MTLNRDLDFSKWHKFKTQLDLIMARKVNPEPLRTDEMIVQISRDEYQSLLELACEALSVRLGKAFAAAAKNEQSPTNQKE